MGETLEDMDEEIEVEDHKNNFLAAKLGFSYEQFIQKIEQVN